MRALFSREEYSKRHAITDVYDEDNHTFLVRYPVWLIVGLCLTGVVAFMLTGFWGFRDSAEPALTGKIFHEPWALYLWFCALILVLQISILRHPSLRRQLAATLTITVISIVLVVILYLYPVLIDDIGTFLNNLIAKIFGPHIILTSSWTYSIINFLIIGVFWFDTIRRWIRRLRGESPTRRIDLNTGEVTYKANETDLPSMQELVSGDLVAGALLVLLLALIFRQEVIGFLFNTTGVTSVHITTCTVSLPGNCVVHPQAGQINPPTLTFIDLIQSLIYLPLGLIILALSATLSGLGAVGGVTGGSASAAQVAPATREGSSAVNVGEQVSITVLNTLRSALNRRIYIALDGLAGSLRTVVWPALIFLGVVAVAASARYIQTYLHLQSDERTCSTAQCPAYTAVQRLLDEHVQFTAPTSALLWGIIAMLAIVFSAALLIYRLRVAENSLRLLALVGFTVLLTFWIFSLALSGFNGLFSLMGISQRVPFPQPGASTVISLLALVIFGSYSLMRTWRSRRLAPPVPVGAAREGDKSTP